MIGARSGTPRPGKEAHRDVLSAARIIMKNFVRLVKFSWPHRFRFGLSIACAAMVALFFFTELFAVLPLLKILFNNENPQRWVSTNIDSIEERIVQLDAQAAEVRRMQQAALVGDLQSPGLAAHYRDLDDELDRVEL